MEETRLKAKRYSNRKYVLAIVDTLFLLLLLILFQTMGLSLGLTQAIGQKVSQYYLVILIYLSIVFVGYCLLDFPLNLYRSFILEHKFNLSQQRFKEWLMDQFKAMAVSFVIIVILAEVFYYIIYRFPSGWWIVASLFWIFFSVVLARLTPVLIIPLFFKYKPLSDNTLRESIKNLADKMQVKILDVFEIDFSKKTLKANAAFVGWGKSRRVVLADTLKDKYTYDEIEVILAHEFAHYQLKHLLKLLLINSLEVILSLYLIFRTHSVILEMLGGGSVYSVASLPVILVYMTVIGVITTPLQNYLSRRFEVNADKIALHTTGLKEGFISMMEKLADQNLADRSPSWWIKIFFFDHPPVDERIEMAKS
jgi:STE24 endopeptidase